MTLTVIFSNVILTPWITVLRRKQPTSRSSSPATSTTSSSTRSCGALPPAVNDTPEDLARRDNAAIAEVASLLPANAEEATLAAQFVAANAQAMDCLRLAREHAADLARVLQCTAQSANMMRQARAARSLLLRVQAARQKREADGAATDKAAWIEHCAVGLMADALGRTPSAPIAEPPPEPGPEDTCGVAAEAVRHELAPSAGGPPQTVTAGLAPAIGPPVPEAQATA